MYSVPFSRPCGTRFDHRNTSQDLRPGLRSIAPTGLNASAKHHPRSKNKYRPFVAETIPQCVVVASLRQSNRLRSMDRLLTRTARIRASGAAGGWRGSRGWAREETPGRAGRAECRSRAKDWAKEKSATGRIRERAWGQKETGAAARRESRRAANRTLRAVRQTRPVDCQTHRVEHRTRRAAARREVCRETATRDSAGEHWALRRARGKEHREPACRDSKS